MAGYLGSKAVLLSTTAANVTGNAEITGDLTVDTSTLFVDSANGSGNVGIGTSSPTGDLDIYRSGADPDIRLTRDTTQSRIATTSAGSLRLQADFGNTAADSFIQLSVDNSEAMRINSDGNVGIGATTVDSQLHIEKAEATAYNGSATDGQLTAGATAFLQQTAGSNNAISQIVFQPRNGYGYNRIVNSGGSAPYMTFVTNDAERLRIDSSGNVGIGTTSPSTFLDIDASQSVSYGSTSNNDVYFEIANRTEADGQFSGMRFLTENASGVASWWNVGAISTATNYNTDLVFQQRTGSSTYAEAMRIDASGNVGIGASSPADPLHIYNTSPFIRLTDASLDTRITRLGGENGNFTIDIDPNQTAAASYFSVDIDNSEAMRIDSSGNLLVGKTASSGTTAGCELRADGNIIATKSGGNPIQCRRLTDDGVLIDFYKDTSNVGSIGTNGGNIYMVRGAISGVGIAGGGQFVATDSSGAASDNTRDLGAATIRWDDVYATNGTIQTSDANEKQDIRGITEAEARVAQACKGLLKAYRWKSAIAEKGDDARIHFGVIAQDLQAAFEAEGLDAGDYAMFIHSTWTDEETGEEKSRMGVRYSELLAFIIGAM